MAKVLNVTASPRGDRSTSRKLAREFADGWLKAHPGDTVTERDVGRHPPGHVTESWVAAAYTPPDQHTPELKAAIRESDALVDELFAHDIILVSAPMYNFGVPSGLKAWIDNIVRVGRTFNFDASKPNPYVPLVHGKRLVVITSKGGVGYGPGGPLAQLNYEDGYLKAIFGFIGVTEASVIAAEATSAGGEAATKSMAQAHEAIAHGAA